LQNTPAPLLTPVDVKLAVNHAAAELSLEIDWTGQGTEEQGIVAAAPADSAVKPGQQIVAVDPRYFRPAEVETLLGNPTKAKEKLGWTPKTSFEELVKEMMASDLENARRDALVTEAGCRAPNHHE
jgi:GDPmannose 4,6-dehydratase